jgi:hypothetical protein
MYERHVGPIPNGYDVHHRCGNRLCVNPEHTSKHGYHASIAGETAN